MRAFVVQLARLFFQKGIDLARSLSAQTVTTRTINQYAFAILQFDGGELKSRSMLSLQMLLDEDQ